MEYVRSNRGAFKLIHGNHVYVKQKVLKNGAVCWECEQRRNKVACKAKLHVLNDQIVKNVNEHTHPANRGEVESIKVRQAMKKRARETEETPQQIISNAVAHLNEHAAVTMPPVHHIRRDIRRQRKMAGNPIPVPQDRFFDIPPIYQETTAGQPFLLHDSGHEENRILVFATNDNIQLLAESPSWFMDGTFKTAPELFFQLYTIHSCTAKKVLPCVYALLPNKQQATYNRLFEILKEHQNNLAPQNVMVDFELAVLNAITTSFPDSSKKGCFFHFSQAIFKKIQSLGLQVRYKDDEDFAHKVRMLAALAFVPEADVIDAFEAVSEDFPFDAQAVIDYFEDTYIGRLRPGGHRRAPLFDMELWNMYNQTIDDLPRTNNAVEGWHRSFQANVGAYHPNFWRFIDILKREQNLTQVNIAQARAGHPAEPQRRRYQDSNQRIKNIVQDYPNRNIMQYLRGLAHNISM